MGAITGCRTGGRVMDSNLYDLPAEAQEALLDMSERDLELLMIEVRRDQFDARAAAYPADGEGAAKGARAALVKPATVVIDDPLQMFAAIFETVREVLAKGAADDLDRTDCMNLWLLTDLADDLLRHHRATVEEANHRLRAHTHPAPQKK